MKLTDEEKALVLKSRREAKKKTHGFEPLDLKTINVETRIAGFNRLFNMALEEYQHVEEHGCESKHFDNWCFEGVMELLGPKVFDGYNAYID